jgi:hypothetical protein
MKKVYAITLGFARPEIISNTIFHYYRTRMHLETKHLIIDQHYPLPSELECTKNLLRLCMEREMQYYDPGVNLGLAKGINFALSKIPDLKNSIVIGYDPDVVPVTPGWDVALIQCLRLYPEVAWASLGNDFSEREMRERSYTEKLTELGVLYYVNRPVLNSICAWDGAWLAEVGGITEHNAYYGGLETHMFPKLVNRKWAFIKDYREIRNEATQGAEDSDYHKYKMDHAHHGKWPGDFKSWLDFRKTNGK